MSFTDAEFAIIGQAVSDGHPLGTLGGASAAEVECHYDMANSALRAGRVRDAYAKFTLLCAYNENDSRFWEKLKVCRCALKDAAQRASPEQPPRMSCTPC